MNTRRWGLPGNYKMVGIEHIMTWTEYVEKHEQEVYGMSKFIES